MIDVLTALARLPQVFGLSEAEAVGLSARIIERAVRNGDVWRLTRGVFVADHVWRRATRRDRHLLLVHAA
ncbi:MAG: type IV toxin-antitoxin system AbiEi family antitoxin domain-containing protein, partial [Actinomycetota bacterium]